MLKRIYVCYHENSRELAADCGSMSDLLVATKPQDAFRWVYDSIEKGDPSLPFPMSKQETSFMEPSAPLSTDFFLKLPSAVLNS